MTPIRVVATWRCALLIMLLGSASLVAAEHISDKLSVDLYATAAADGEPVRSLQSGTPVEVIEKGDGVSRIRLADETVGWVKTDYLSNEKPARMMLLEAQAELRRLRAGGNGDNNGDEARAAPDEEHLPTAREAELRQSLKQAEQRIRELEARVADQPTLLSTQLQLVRLQTQVEEALTVLAEASGMELRQTEEQPERSLIERYLPWIVGVVTLLLGIGLGVAFIDYRIRKRYGGFRI